MPRECRTGKLIKGLGHEKWLSLTANEAVIHSSTNSR
jgi:hypothetical protein